MLSYNKGRYCRKLSYLLFPGLGEDWIRKELKKLDGEPCRAETQISEDGAWPPPCLLLRGQRKWMESPRPQWTARAAHLCGNTARVPVHNSIGRSMQKQNDRRKKMPLSHPALQWASSIFHWQSILSSQLAKEKYYLSHKVPESQSKAERGSKFTTGTRRRGTRGDWKKLFAVCISVKGLIHRI